MSKPATRNRFLNEFWLPIAEPTELNLSNTKNKVSSISASKNSRWDQTNFQQKAPLNELMSHPIEKTEANSDITDSESNKANRGDKKPDNEPKIAYQSDIELPKVIFTESEPENELTVQNPRLEDVQTQGTSPERAYPQNFRGSERQEHLDPADTLPSGGGNTTSLMAEKKSRMSSTSIEDAHQTEKNSGTGYAQLSQQQRTESEEKVSATSSKNTKSIFLLKKRADEGSVIHEIETELDTAVFDGTTASGGLWNYNDGKLILTYTHSFTGIDTILLDTNSQNATLNIHILPFESGFRFAENYTLPIPSDSESNVDDSLSTLMWDEKVGQHSSFAHTLKDGTSFVRVDGHQIANPAPLGYALKTVGEHEFLSPAAVQELNAGAVIIGRPQQKSKTIVVTNGEAGEVHQFEVPKVEWCTVNIKKDQTVQVDLIGENLENIQSIKLIDWSDEGSTLTEFGELLSGNHLRLILPESVAKIMLETGIEVKTSEHSHGISLADVPTAVNQTDLVPVGSDQVEFGRLQSQGSEMDSAVALQDLVDRASLQALLSGQAQKIVIEPGTYRLDGSIRLKPGVHLEGEGFPSFTLGDQFSELNSAVFFLGGSHENRADVSLSAFSIDAKTHPDLIAISLRYGRNVSVEEMSVQGGGYKLVDLTGSSGSRVLDSNLIGGRIDVTASSNVHIERNSITANQNSNAQVSTAGSTEFLILGDNVVKNQRDAFLNYEDAIEFGSQGRFFVSLDRLESSRFHLFENNITENFSSPGEHGVHSNSGEQILYETHSAWRLEVTDLLKQNLYSKVVDVPEGQYSNSLLEFIGMDIVSFDSEGSSFINRIVGADDQLRELYLERDLRYDSELEAAYITTTNSGIRVVNNHFDGREEIAGPLPPATGNASGVQFYGGIFQNIVIEGNVFSDLDHGVFAYTNAGRVGKGTSISDILIDNNIFADNLKFAATFRASEISEEHMLKLTEESEFSLFRDVFIFENDFSGVAGDVVRLEVGRHLRENEYFREQEIEVFEYDVFGKMYAVNNRIPHHVELRERDTDVVDYKESFLVSKFNQDSDITGSDLFFLQWGESLLI